MTVVLELPVVEQLFSKAFHDLVSPIGAVANGVELMEEMGNEVGAQALNLISHSSGKAARRLQFFRLAYGAAGTRDTVDVGNARSVTLGYFEESKITVTWPAEISLSADICPRGSIKILLNVILLASESLAHGGTIDVSVEADEGTGRMQVVAEGDRATMKPEYVEALGGRVDLDEINPHNVQAYATGRFVEFFGFTIAVDQESDTRLILNLAW